MWFFLFGYIGQFIQPTSVNFSRANRSSFRENAKKRKIPYAFTTTVPTATVLVTPAGYTLPRWQFAITRAHLH